MVQPQDINSELGYKLLALAERARTAVSADHILDAEIHCSIRGYTMHEDSDPSKGIFAFWHNGICTNCSSWSELTASLDEAMTMIPDKWHISEMGEGPSITPRPRDFRYNGTGYVQLHYMKETEEDRSYINNLVFGSAATLPLAMVEACLKAHAVIAMGAYLK